jgi:hypothetical protein
MSQTFECQRCGYVASTKANLIKHLKRVTPCSCTQKNISCEVQLQELTTKVIENGYKCKYCDKMYVNQCNVYRHQKTCKVKDDENDLKNVVEELRKEVNQLKKQLTAPTTSNITNNTNNGTVNNSINIQIKNFGNENMAALPSDVIKDSFVNLDFKNVFENLYCDDNYPENQNVKLKSKKDKQLLMYKSDKWNVTTFDYGLEEIFNKLYGLFDEFARHHQEEAMADSGEEEYYKMKRLLQAASDKLDKAGKKFRKGVDNDIICALEEKKLVV